MLDSRYPVVQIVEKRQRAPILGRFNDLIEAVVGPGRNRPLARSALLDQTECIVVDEFTPLAVAVIDLAKLTQGVVLILDGLPEAVCGLRQLAAIVVGKSARLLLFIEDLLDETTLVVVEVTGSTQRIGLAYDTATLVVGPGGTVAERVALLDPVVPALAVLPRPDRTVREDPADYIPLVIELRDEDSTVLVTVLHHVVIVIVNPLLFDKIRCAEIVMTGAQAAALVVEPIDLKAPRIEDGLQAPVGGELELGASGQRNWISIGRTVGNHSALVIVDNLPDRVPLRIECSGDVVRIRRVAVLVARDPAGDVRGRNQTTLSVIAVTHSSDLGAAILIDQDDVSDPSFGISEIVNPRAPTALQAVIIQRDQTAGRIPDFDQAFRFTDHVDHAVFRLKLVDRRVVRDDEIGKARTQTEYRVRPANRAQRVGHPGVRLEVDLILQHGRERLELRIEAKADPLAVGLDDRDPG